MAFVTSPGPIFQAAAGLMYPCAAILDAQPPRVRIRNLSAYRGDLISVYRPKNITSAEKHAIVDYAVAHYDEHLYGVGKILLHLFGLQRYARVDRWPICSWSVAEPMAHAISPREFTFGGAPEVATPQSMYDFCRMNPTIYDPVVKLGVLEQGRVKERAA